jgi:hypothetical protein
MTLEHKIKLALTLSVSAVLVAIMFVMTGCSKMVFKNNGSTHSLAQDKYDCELALGYRGHAGGNRPTDQLADYIVRGRSETKACLESKGWIEVAAE